MAENIKNMNDITKISFRVPGDDECSKNTVPLSIFFSFLEGKATRVAIPHRFGWRTVPVDVCCLTEIGDGGRPKIEVAGRPDVYGGNGAISFIPAGTPHRFSCDGPDSYISYWLHFNVFVSGNLELFSLYDMPNVIPADEAGNIGILIKEIISQPRNLTLNESLHQQLLGNALALELLRFGKFKYNAEALKSDLLRLLPALNYLAESMEKISTNQLAGKVNLSASRFLALFKQLTGMSPGKYQESGRIRRAGVMLAMGKFSLAEIAQELHYSDAFHFSRKFKEFTGVSPKEYRKRIN